MELNVEAVVETLRREGYAVLGELLDQPTLEAMGEEFSSAPSRLPSYSYPFGEQYRAEAMEMRGPLSSSMPVTAEVLLDGPLASVCLAYGAEEERDLFVWSHEFTRDTEAIYGIPHFDRRHQLKVFVYLTDVDEDSGPTHVASERPEDFHARWLRAWREALGMDGASDREVLEQVRATSEDSSVYRSVACEVDLPRNEFEPLTGKAGTVVVFDTSLAHFGGLVMHSSASRRTVRRHCLLD
ncbi:MAG TPA: hypothetical protein VFT79_13495 [Solirubrobacterales bacterium]|nr:hypothetical protein [Solirubrobacterales bacterium]